MEHPSLVIPAKAGTHRIGATGKSDHVFALPFDAAHMGPGLRRDDEFGQADGSREAGFTLVELLVALAIFGLLAVAGSYLLGFAVEAQGRTDHSLDRVAAVRRAASLLTADMAQIVPRASRDERGARQPAVIGTAEAIRFVRSGWTNDRGATRSTLQKVGYSLVDGALQRTSWPLVDGVAAEHAVRSPLIKGVSRLGWRYRKDGVWSDGFVPARPGDMPDAVELSMTIEGVGEVRQALLVGIGR